MSNKMNKINAARVINVIKPADMKMQHTILISLAIIIGAQIHFNLFHTDFKISIGTLAFAVALAIFGEYRVILVTIVSATGVVITRALFYWMNWGVMEPGRFLPEFVFYLVYGVVFYAYCRKQNYEITTRSAGTILAIDVLANLVELLCRVPTYTINWQTIFCIFLIAVLRTAIIIFILWCLNYYKFSLLRKEHAERYQKLLMLISRLNDEVVLMQRNRKMMESVMSTSYRLFQEMEKNSVDEELTKKALNIAKDVHELKKEYSLILRGLSEAMELNTKEEGMDLQTISRVLQHSMKQAVPKGRNVEILFDYEENLYTEKHYFLLSMFRNLINNAIEASDKETAHISVFQKTTSQEYLFMVKDDGPGIDKENLDQIFQPGFSTKINFETGEINRGLGLELVKDLVENQWEGIVEVKSVPGETIFTIRIPKEKWKGEI